MHADPDSPLTAGEVDEALHAHALKCGKTGGKNGLLSEQVKRVGVGFKEHILELYLLRYVAVWDSTKGLSQRQLAKFIHTMETLIRDPLKYIGQHIYNGCLFLSSLKDSFPFPKYGSLGHYQGTESKQL